MDGRSFDRFARRFSAAGTRRDALRAVFGVVVLGAMPNLVDAKKRGQTGQRNQRRGKGNDQNDDKPKGQGKAGNQRRERKKVRAQALPGGCCSSGTCTPGAGKNLARCCYNGLNLTARNFKGANLGGANFTGATLIDANFSSANLDKVCFVDADLTNARLAGSNTGTAIFCRTTMPNGSENNSGCEKGTKCCPTCELPCPDEQRCCADGTCAECCSNAQCASSVCCRGVCCADGVSCNDGACGVCAPDCENRECGSDGCAGDCEPGCSDAEPVCTTTGRCVECVDPGDCPDPGPCQTRSCVSNTCQPQMAIDSSNPRGACPGAQVCCNGACAGCCVSGDCAPPANGTATCFQGHCNKFCDNTLHRVCGTGAGVCQECCGDDNQCASIGGPCVDGTCTCPSANESRCGMECFDLSSEPNNCGVCGRECASGTCINGQCREPEPCGLLCNPQHDPDCEPVECTGAKECTRAINGICVCPEGLVDCDGDGVCEACGRCDVTVCPADPESGAPGVCCPGGYCSCGGQCCAGPECWVTVQRDGEGSPIPGSEQEQCDNTGGCVDCWGACCSACINGNCASSGPIRGGSARR